MRSRYNIIAVLAFYCSLLTANCSLLYAQWPTNVNDALFIDNGRKPVLVVDPFELSVFVAYQNGTQIKVKKFDQYGYPMWNGQSVVLVDTAVSCFGFPLIMYAVSDDSGGIIVCWEDHRHSTYNPDCYPYDSEIYIQRADVNAQIRYQLHGKRISSHAYFGYKFVTNMVRDTRGGMIIGFADSARPSLFRYDRNGQLIWERFFPGAALDLHDVDQQGCSFVSYWGNGANGRQKLDLNGNHLWPDTLIGVIPDDLWPTAGGAVSDGMGGIIGVTARNNSNYTVYVNRIDSNGNYLFGNGIDLCSSTNTTLYTSDCLGGIYISYYSNESILQRVDLNGSVIFDSCGITPSGYIVGGISNDVITIFSLGNNPILFFSQKIDKVGNKLWDSLNVFFYQTYNDLFPYDDFVISDKKGGVICSWTENGQLLMKQISKNGIIGDTCSVDVNDENLIATKSFELYQNYPNPFNSSTTIKYFLYHPSLIELKLYNILGQEVKTLEKGYKTPGYYSISVDCSQLSSGLYFYHLKTNTESKTRKLLFIK